MLEYLTSSCYAHSAKAFAREVDRREGEEQQGEEQQQQQEGGGSARLKRKQSLGAMRMEGVEATELDRDGMLVEQEQGDNDDSEDQEVERSLVKSVAFKLDRNGVQQPHEEEEQEEEEEEGWSLLSKAQLDEVRLRRGMFSSCDILAKYPRPRSLISLQYSKPNQTSATSSSRAGSNPPSNSSPNTSPPFSLLPDHLQPRLFSKHRNNPVSLPLSSSPPLPPPAKTSAAAAAVTTRSASARLSAPGPSPSLPQSSLSTSNYKPLSN